MKKKGCLIAIIIVVVLAISIYGYVKGKYNSFVQQQLDVENNWAEVENQLKRRYDLIPNLVETVKGYASHEKDVFTQVTQARASVGQAETRQESIDANNQLTGALSRLLLTVEAYPELKANQNFLQLQSQLEETEKFIANSRTLFNETAKNYNIYIKKFPKNFWSKLFGFNSIPYFESDKNTHIVPKVIF